MSGGGDGLAGGDDWVSVRRRYEDGREPVAAIAAEAGVSAHALVSRARAEGWALRRASRGKANDGTRATIGRLKALLQQRLSELEQQIGSLTEQASAATSERDIRATNTLVRTLEKVLELERKERAQRARLRKSKRRFDDAERESLAKKLAGLHRELSAGGPDAPAGGAGPAPGGGAEP